jgi:hypothetical protein
MTAAAWMFGVGGAILVGIGGFFLLARPALLPEDLRYLCRTAREIDAAVPSLRRWLRLVFIVLGGYAVATGTLTAFFLAATDIRNAEPWAVAVLAALGCGGVVDRGDRGGNGDLSCIQEWATGTYPCKQGPEVRPDVVLPAGRDRHTTDRGPRMPEVLDHGDTHRVGEQRAVGEDTDEAELATVGHDASLGCQDSTEEPRRLKPSVRPFVIGGYERGRSQELDGTRRERRNETMRHWDDEGHITMCADVASLAGGRPRRHVQG